MAKRLDTSRRFDSPVPLTASDHLRLHLSRLIRLDPESRPPTGAYRLLTFPHEGLSPRRRKTVPIRRDLDAPGVSPAHAFAVG